ncbi:MAG: hypothetical protein RL885_10630 [Planctomycetota bacterium]
MIRSEVILKIAAPLVLLAILPASLIAQEKAKAFDRSRLGFTPERSETALGLAIELARLGDLDRARSVLAPFAAEERVAREIERLEALSAFRDELLQSKLGKAIRLTEGAEISKIRAIEEDRIELSSKAGDETVPLSRIGAVELTSIQGRRRVSGDQAWISDYLLLLIGEEDPSRFLDDDDVLSIDAASFQELRKIGRAAQRLEALARLESSSLALVQIEGLAELRDLPLVQERLPVLRQYARELIFQSFDPSSPEGLGIQAKATRSPDGQLLLTYDFQDAEQLQDFAADPEWYSINRRRLLGKGKETPVVFEVEGGGLEMKGASCYRHALAFEAPINIRYKVIYHDATDDPNPYFMMGMVAQKDESHIGFENVTRLYSINRKDAVQRAKFLDTSFIAGNLYSIELEHQGGDKAKVTIDTNWREVESQGMKSGGIVLFFQAVNGVRLEQLEIEGTPVIDEATKQQWINARLEKLGLSAGE